MVYEDHIKVQLKADIDSLLKTGVLPEDAANFNSGTKNIESHCVGADGSVRPQVDEDIGPYEIAQGAAHRKDKVFRVSVISSSAPPVTGSIDTVGKIRLRNGQFGQTLELEIVHNNENESGVCAAFSSEP